MTQTYSLGLDLGTTTISAVLVDAAAGTVLESSTQKTNACLPPARPGEKSQDPGILVTLARDILDGFLDRYPGVQSIGITGQMHGILYLDREGRCISPLYTWQDQQSAALCPRLSQLTGYPIAPGYGLATHCALMEANAVPEGAWKLCTVMDYLVYTLCGKHELLTHASNASSMGLFSLEQGDFDQAALDKACIDPSLLPTVTGKTMVQGRYRGIPVAVALGDNQASFLGSVPHPETMALVNFGTGSQISRMVPALPENWSDERLEIRPYLDGTFLICGSALCGGRAYALLESFFRQILPESGPEQHNCYPLLNRLAMEGLRLPELPLVETTFCGTRWDPERRGSITNLGEDNFTPAALAAGTLLGMARELQELLIRMPGDPVLELAASGNGVRNNPALTEAIARVFGVQSRIPPQQEEAAFGACLFSMTAAQCNPHR